MNDWKKYKRLSIQLLFLALSNGYMTGFLQGKIWKGKSKQLCLPGLNCYSCPGALGACPVGALQAVLNDRKYHVSFYILGFLMLAGALAGRVICAFLCPFGLVQDLLYKIPFPIKKKRLPIEKYLRKIKYFILVVMVLLLPAVLTNFIGQGTPWFCKWICPSGTLFGGIPLLAVNVELRESIGLLFGWKIGMLLALLFLSIITLRPFCKYLCPLGVIYGMCNHASIYHYEVEKDKCTHCGACTKACGFDLKIHDKPNQSECIRCGECIKACPQNAIKSSFGTEKQKKEK